MPLVVIREGSNGSPVSACRMNFSRPLVRCWRSLVIAVMVITAGRKFLRRVRRSGSRATPTHASNIHCSGFWRRSLAKVALDTPARAAVDVKVVDIPRTASARADCRTEIHAMAITRRPHRSCARQSVGG